MDRGQFDALARMVSTARSRRSALAVLLGAALFRHEPARSLARHPGRSRKRARAAAEAQASTCYPGTRCTTGRGKNASRCNFSNTALFVNRDARGANLSNSNFTGADATGADFRGANLSGACFVDVSLRGAKLGVSVNLHNAIFCNAIMPDGSRNDSGCDKGTACCPTTSPTGTCRLLNELCGIISGPCCGGNGDCIAPPLSTCQSYCATDQECQQRFPNYDVECGEQAACGDRKCCRHKTCRVNSDCPHKGSCCHNTISCCYPGQDCLGGGCLSS